jgi:ubiquinone/menaquinone biosynthesis C-methylase UbiE
MLLRRIMRTVFYLLYHPFAFTYDHLLRLLRDRGLAAVGLDESAPMGALAKNRLRRSGHPAINLVRGLSQDLPFIESSFHTIVSTFPSEYIFHPRTLAEVRRCLVDGGRLVVLPVAWHVGRKMTERFLAWLFRFTGESPRLDEIIIEHLWRPIEKAGFQVEIKKIEVKSSLLLIIIATK